MMSKSKGVRVPLYGERTIANARTNLEGLVISRERAISLIRPIERESTNQPVVIRLAGENQDKDCDP